MLVDAAASRCFDGALICLNLLRSSSFPHAALSLSLLASSSPALFLHCAMAGVQESVPDSRIVVVVVAPAAVVASAARVIIGRAVISPELEAAEQT